MINLASPNWQIDQKNLLMDNDEKKYLPKMVHNYNSAFFDA